MKKNILSLLIILLPLLLMFGCGEHYVPKPRGYFRIELPEKHYVKFDTAYPYMFEYASVCNIIPNLNDTLNDPFWINIDYPNVKGTIFLSYKKIENNLAVYVTDSWEFVNKHIPKADAIMSDEISYPERKVYGVRFTIQGSGAASPSQFYITDSTNHFIRGALYFDVIPNNDSLQPAIDYINKDIDHFLNTLKWKSDKEY
jgi:gliding motility-associated lipoprotein GldD